MFSHLHSHARRGGARLCAALLVAASALVAGVAGAADAPLRVGMVNAQTGPAAGLGQGMREGAQAVFDEVNARGGIHGRPLELRVADDGYEPDRTVEATLGLVQADRVVALLGYVGTPTSNAALPLVNEMGVPIVGLFTGAMSLRSAQARSLFNVRASYDDETELLVARLHAGGARSVAVVYQYDSFGLAVLAGTERALKRRGLAVSSSARFHRNTVAVQEAARTMIAAKPDAIIVAAPYAPLAALAKALMDGGSAAQLATVSFVGTDELMRSVGASNVAEGLLISQVVPFPAGDTTAIGRDCRRLLQTRAARPLGFVNFEGCISAKVLVEALRRAGPDPTSQRVIQALDEMDIHDFGGIALNFANGRRQAMDTAFLTQVRQGKVVELVVP